MKTETFTLETLKAFYPFLNEREKVAIFEHYTELRTFSDIAVRHADMFGGIALMAEFSANCGIAKIKESDIGDYIE